LAAMARPGSLPNQLALGLACYVSGDAVTARGTWEKILAENPGESRATAYLTMLDRASED